MLTACQRAADAAMIKVCGSTENCDELVVDNGAGTRSFKYEVCHYNGFETATSQDGSKLPMPKFDGVCYGSLDAVSQQDLTNQPDGQGWSGRLSGLVYWGEISYDDEQNQFTTEKEYLKALKDAGFELTEDEQQVVHDRVFGTEIKALTNAVATAINAIESDPKVQYCMTGREFQGYKEMLGTGSTTHPRFPHLTSQMRQIVAISALKNARDNYMVKYDEEIQRMMKDQVKAAQRIDKEAATDQAHLACNKWAESSILPKSEAPKANNAGKWIAFGVLVAVAVVATIFSFGSAAPVAAFAVGSLAVELTTTTLAATAAIAAGVGAAATVSSIEPVGEAEIDDWNYSEKVTTNFNRETGECTKVTVTKNCEKTKKNYCDLWKDPVETSTTIKLLD